MAHAAATTIDVRQIGTASSMGSRWLTMNLHAVLRDAVEWRTLVESFLVTQSLSQQINGFYLELECTCDAGRAPRIPC